MRLLDIAKSFSAGRGVVSGIQPEQLTTLSATLRAIRADIDATQRVVDDALRAGNDLLDGLEAVGEQAPVPPVQYVEVAAFARLANRVNGLQNYMRGIADAIPATLSEIDNVPQQ